MCADVPLVGGFDVAGAAASSLGSTKLLTSGSGGEGTGGDDEIEGGVVARKGAVSCVRISRSVADQGRTRSLLKTAHSFTEPRSHKAPPREVVAEGLRAREIRGVRALFLQVEKNSDATFHSSTTIPSFWR
mmetsp:Transcript_2973/g.7775  ORF Transcript_2973/g.7775 Transcript_2973/m.7775 type:complete len:131 (+) Transcript_2973:457-849(+)